MTPLAENSYLIIHGITTVGAILVFFIRNEHRMTKTETTLDLLLKDHDRRTAQGPWCIEKTPLEKPF